MFKNMQNLKAFAIECTIKTVLPKPEISHDTRIFMLKTGAKGEYADDNQTVECFFLVGK